MGSGIASVRVSKTQNDAAFCAGYEYGVYETTEQAGSINALQNFREILPVVSHDFI
jgi:hypothetical protein